MLGKRGGGKTKEGKVRNEQRGQRIMECTDWAEALDVQVCVISARNLT